MNNYQKILNQDIIDEKALKEIDDEFLEIAPMSEESIFYRGIGKLLDNPKTLEYDIIDKANIGRTTFYSHFETKESLLEDLCTELFGHIIDTAKGIPHGHYNFSCGTSNDSVFLHLLRHLQENDYNILQLLSSQNNEIFLQYFKSNLQHLIQIQYAEKGLLKNMNKILPKIITPSVQLKWTSKL